MHHGALTTPYFVTLQISLEINKNSFDEHKKIHALNISAYKSIKNNIQIIFLHTVSQNKIS